MPATQFLQHVPHDPDCIMSLVTDVERYPDFIPAMAALRKTKALSDGFEAEAMINFKGIAETFASKVIIDPEARTLVVTKSRRGGAVKSLDNRWAFHTMPDGSTLVDFSVDVRLVFPFETLLRQKFDQARIIIRDVFVEQAKEHCPLVGDASKLDLMAEATRLGLANRLA